MSLLAFIGNILEPIAYLVYVAAVYLYGKKNRQPQDKVLLVYYSIGFVTMLASAVMVEMDAPETIWLYNVHALVTVWLLGAYFRHILEGAARKNTVTVMTAAITLYLLYKNLVLREFHLFDSVGYSLVSFSVVLYVLLYFHQLLSNVTDENIFHNFNFWLTTGYLIYFLGSFIIFLTYHYLTTKILATFTMEEQLLLTSLWGLHNCLLFTSAGLLLGGSLWLGYRRKSVLL